MNSSNDRFGAVDRVRQGWISRLIDLSRRNNLLYYRDLKTGTLDLSSSNPKAIASLMGGESVPLTRLVDGDAQKQATACIQQIHRRALINLEEKGLETLFLALGMATWDTGDAGRPPEAALILIPVKIETHGVIKLQRNGEAQINPILLHILEVNYKINVTPQDLLKGSDSIAEDDFPDLVEISKKLKQKVQEIKEFDVISRLVLSNFSFQKMAMVRDLNHYLEQMVNHDIVAAIAGNTQAQQAVKNKNKEEFDVRELDQTLPEDDFLVFDADSSQQKVIREALSGGNCVIQGPPGTGKSQTIANLIAALSAKGLKTLFVAEKRAALEVVMQRLQSQGLGHLLLDFNSADISRRAVMEQFAESLNLVRNAPLVDAGDIHRRFVDRRDRLRNHVSRIHDKQLPSQKSIYELQGELLQFPEQKQATTRIKGENLKNLTPENVQQVDMLLQELSGKNFADIFLENKTSELIDFSLSLENSQQALKLVENLIDLHPELRDTLARFSTETRFNAPETFSEIKEQVRLVESVEKTLSTYSSELFRQNLKEKIERLSPLRGGFINETMAWFFNSKFNQTIDELKKIRVNKTDDHKKILEEVEKAASQLKQWRFLATPDSTPTKIKSLRELQKYLQSVLEDLHTLGFLLDKKNLNRITLSELDDLVKSLPDECDFLRYIARIRDIEKRIKNFGAESFLRYLKQTKSNPSHWRDQFKYVWLASCLDKACFDNPKLIGFDGVSHEQIIQEFRDLDKERINLSIQRVYRAHAERAIEIMNQHPEQEALVRREAFKKTRHLPLRKLLAKAPDVLTTLRPCWMASPLSVSQLLDANRRYFDVVIFDEASQVLPEDAVTSILRAERIVVAGDKYQLPPTTFFAAKDDSEEETESPAEGFESLLDLVSSFIDSRMLQWHYRSRCEELIAFSNKHIYSDRLVTFPNPSHSRCISHVLVPSISDQDGQEESASQEVQSVVALVLKHATDYPDQTLGVITMGIKHANRIQAVLDQALKDRPELGAFFDDSRTDRFFIKNIERVQGDERDVIILSVGYGKDRSGNLPYRFGPLLGEGGERRLNVAITRAKQRMILVSSFGHLDMDPNRSKSRGVGLLRLYLQYAASEGRLLGEIGHSDIPLNPFEQDIFDALNARGISLVPQWGASGYRIDMVAKHPEREGEFVLAIECDGATYHSLPTVRERDRLRQQQLEALGWRFHRIWSTDWFSRRESEIERTVAAYQIAVQQANQCRLKAQQSTRKKSEISSQSSQSDQPTVTIQTSRKPRPNVPKRGTIDQYSLNELVELIQWILSDGCLPTDDEIVSEMVRELGFKRRGTRIEAKVLAAIQRVRNLT